MVYNVGKLRLLNGDTSLDSSDLRMLIVITSKTGADDPDLGTLAAIDAVGTVAFHSERVALSSLTVTQDNTNNRATADCGNVTFAAAPGVTALAAIIYDHAAGGSDSARYPISFHDTNFPQPMDGGLVVSVADYLRAS